MKRPAAQWVAGMRKFLDLVDSDPAIADAVEASYMYLADIYMPLGHLSNGAQTAAAVREALSKAGLLSEEDGAGCRITLAANRLVVLAEKAKPADELWQSGGAA